MSSELSAAASTKGVRTVPPPKGNPLKRTSSIQILISLILVSPCLAEEEQPAGFRKAMELAGDHYEKGKLQEAIAAFSHAIELSPEASSYYGRAVVWHDLENWDRAIKDFSCVIELKPQLANAYFFRAVCLARKNEPNKALSDITIALEMLPDNETYLIYRATLWRILKQHEKAISDLSRAIGNNPRNPHIYFIRATCWFSLEESEKAKTDIDNSLKLKPTDPNCYIFRGNIHCELEEYEKARMDYEHAVRLDEKNPVMLTNLMHFLAFCPDKEFRDCAKATELASKVCEMSDLKDPKYFRLIAEVYAETGNIEKAIKWQRFALKLAPNDSDTREILESYEAMRATELRR